MKCGECKYVLKANTPTCGNQISINYGNEIAETDYCTAGVSLTGPAPQYKGDEKVTEKERLNNITKVLIEVIRRTSNYSMYDQIKVCDLICNHEFSPVDYGYYGYEKYDKWEKCSICGILKPVGGWID